MRFDRLAFGPVAAAARSSRGILSGEAERAVDAVFAGPWPETIGRSLAEHHVLERVASELLETSSANGDGPGPTADALTHTLVESAAFKRALADVLSSPEIRTALTSQSVGFADELASSIGRRARASDLRLDGVVGHQAPRSLEYGGLSTRGVALVLDAALAQLAFLVGAASIALVLALAGGLGDGWLDGSLAGAGWFLAVGAYFVAFWSGTGQTPGMRALRVRLVDTSGRAPPVLRSVVRFVGLILAIIPLGAGFLPVIFDSRRRGLHDFLSGTVVLDETVAPPSDGSLDATSPA